MGKNLTKAEKRRLAKKERGHAATRRGAGAGKAAADRLAASKAAGSFVSVADREKLKAEIKVAKRTQKRRSVSPPNPQEAKREAKEAKEEAKREAKEATRAVAAAAAPTLDRSDLNQRRQISRNAAKVAEVERALGPARFAQALEHRGHCDSKGIQLFVQSSETSSVATEIVDRIASAFQATGPGGNRHVLAAATARVPGRGLIVLSSSTNASPSW